MVDVDCVFCDIVAKTAPATIVREWPDAVSFVPLNPVISGHLLVVPRVHVRDAVESPVVTAMVMARATELAANYNSSNILTSTGRPATQSIFHLHLHVVPRFTDDQLMLPWGTTGNPHEPHRCAGMERLAAELDKMGSPTEGRSVAANMTITAMSQESEPVVRYVGVPHEAWLRRG